MWKNSSKWARPSSDTWQSLFPVLRVLGIVQACFGGLMLIPALVGWLYGQMMPAHIFAGCALLTIVTGVAMWLCFRRYQRDLMPRDGVLLVPLTWTWLPLFAGLPFLAILYYVDRPIDFSHAYFEAVSALTTTGNSVLTKLDSLPIALNFWRTFLQWIGGLGVIILAVAVLPLLGVGATQLLRVEMAGPIKDAKLTPRISTTAKGLWGIYVLFSVLCTLAYWAAGMEPMDAVMHMFGTVSLGGLTPHDGSLGYFNSPLIELIALCFMVLGSISFTLYFVCFRRRSVFRIWKDPEARATLTALFGCGLFVSLLLWVKGTYPFMEALRLGMFNVISIATTTGYSSADYLQWPVFIPVFMLMLSGIVTGAGSTGGGIKMIRMLILIKQTQREIRRMVHPRAVQPVTIDGRVVDDSVIFSVLAFMLVYGVTIISLSMVLLLTDMDMVSAFSAILASVHCMGIGLGEVGPTGSFAHFTNFQIWVCSAAMLLGRLEMLSFLAILMPSFWKK